MKKILIIEDDVFLGDVLNVKMENSGFEVMLARDGTEGYEAIKSFNPDLVLLDIILPNMNGYEILEAKQKDKTISKIPVIIVSNSGQPVEISRALALGVKDYIVKAQFDPDEVLVKVQAQLRINETDHPTSDTSVPKGVIDGKSNKADLGGKKVLWVEDDQFLNDIIALKLSMAKCIFFHASDGEEALKIIDEEMPDIVMLDIILTGMNGFEILSRIKANSKTKHIPVIILSNLGQPEDVKKSKDLGAARFLIKATITPNEIIDQIKQVIIENGNK